MALGNSTWSIRAGGGRIRASSQQLARTVVHIDCSPLAPANTLIPIGDASSIPSLLDTGRLAEACAFTAKAGQAKYAIAPTPSVVGAASAVTQVGSGAGTVAVSFAPHKSITIKCTTSGAIGTMKVQFSLDGGTTYGPVTASADTGGGTWVYRVPGTYCTLTFAAANYVATKTNVIGVDGTVTPGAAWVGVVTQASSPIDDYEAVCSITKGGALGVAVMVVSLDNGNSTLPSMLIPSGGVVVVPGTGLVLTCASTFVLGDTYSFLTVGPTFSTSDLTAAMNVVKATRTLQASMIHVSAMPASAAAAFSMASTLDSSVLDAFVTNIFDWEGCCDCPSKAGGMRLTSKLSGRKHIRPLSWLAMYLYCQTDPKDELAAVATGELPIFLPAGATSIAGPGDIVSPSGTPLYDTADSDATIISARGVDLSGRTSVFVGGRDEAAAPGLDDVQINTARTYGGPLAAFLSITSGVIGWKNLTTNASYVDAGAVRALNIMIAALRPVAVALLGQRPKVNLDGTISEQAASSYDTVVDGAVKRAMGLVKGGDFVDAQCSFASASILRSSQLGQNPKRLDIAYQFQPLGEVTAVSNVVNFSGVLSITQ
jgi:hypothetical protein